MTEWWNIPTLYLYDPRIMPSFVESDKINPYVQTIRTNEFFEYNDSIYHPTAAGQKYRSTIIENFIRSL